MFPKNIRYLLLLMLVLTWTSMVVWVIKKHRPTFTDDGRLQVHSFYREPTYGGDVSHVVERNLEPTYGGDISHVVERNLKNDNVTKLYTRKKIKELGRKGINVGKPRHSFSDIIKELGISLFKDTDPGLFFINVNKSHETSVSRKVPDTRFAECASVPYDAATLPVASIVIPLHNEPWSTFERLINSILKNSPPTLIHEIIIIEDMSNLDHLGAPLDKYVAQFDFMRIHRAHERLGTMKSRNLGTSIATGDVVVFLDSHTEVNVGWLEPLLYEIDKDPTSVIQPSIDVIDSQSFDYRQYFANNIRGHFEWNMGFHFVPLTPKQKAEVAAKPTKAFNTPAIVGCAFAVNRKYYLDIGGLDSGMRTWGGEDVELSIRVWLCGGSMKISPCSHVAHIFKVGHPFKMQYIDLVYNNQRTAEMWLGHYKRYFYNFSGGFARPPGPSTKFDAMDKVKQKFTCKGFEWFLQNVYPELEVPPDGSEHFGHLRNLGSGDCYRPSEQPILGDYPILVISECFHYYKLRNFALLEDGRLQMEGKCIEVDKHFLVVTPCKTGSGKGKWELKRKFLYYVDEYGSRLCVMQVIKTVNLVETAVAMTMSCNDHDSKFAEWEIGTNLNKGKEAWTKT